MGAAEWEERFKSWAQPPSESEQQRIENAVTAIRKALGADPMLAANTKVYVQGSFRNRVNVRQDSDVDIGVLYTGSTFFPYYPPGTDGGTFGNVDSSYTYSSFKDSIGAALVKYFGSAAVSRGNKAFDVHANSYRVDADVVPVFVHRRYSADMSYICGVELRPDKGMKIINWPERLFDELHWPNQHYEMGVAKNEATGRAFKGAVRILKKIRYDMADAGYAAAKAVPGFLVECLVYNVPNPPFSLPTWDQTMQRVLTRIWADTKTKESCWDYEEVSGLKWLFRGDPEEKRVQAHTFIDQAWDYIGVRKYE